MLLEFPSVTFAPKVVPASIGFYPDGSLLDRSYFEYGLDGNPARTTARFWTEVETEEDDYLRGDIDIVAMQRHLLETLEAEAQARAAVEASSPSSMDLEGEEEGSDMPVQSKPGKESVRSASPSPSPAESAAFLLEASSQFEVKALNTLATTRKRSRTPDTTPHVTESGVVVEAVIDVVTVDARPSKRQRTLG